MINVGVSTGPSFRKLDLGCRASQTRIMAHSYIRMDFGTDEEKAQQARHKLDGWKQAFRLDKRLLYKLERPESEAGEAVSKPEVVEKPAPAAKSAGKKAASSKAKTAAKTSKPPRRRNQPQAPMAKWACWSGSIFPRTKSFPSSAGWTAFRPKSHSRALHQKLSIRTTRNSNRSTSNSRLSRNLSEACFS